MRAVENVLGDRPARAGPRGIVAALLAADVAFAFQQTAIVPAIHDVQQALGGSREWSAWLVTVYLIVATVATLAMGRLADLYGRRRLLLIGLGVFLLASLGAAAAPNMAVLLALRAVQGVGGSVYPLTLAVARERLPDRQVSAAVAASAAAFGMGTVLGFAGGGLLAQAGSWRLIFVVGAVLVGIGAALVARYVPTGEERARGGFDLRGTVALSLAVVALLTGLTLVVPLGWSSPVTAVLLAVTIAGGWWWLRLQRRLPDPLVSLQVLRTRSVLRANLATIGLGWGLFSTYLLVPEFARADPMRAHYGLSVDTAAVGMLLLPLALGQTVAGPLAGVISRRTSSRAVFAGGLVLLAAAFAALAVIRGSTAGIVVVLVSLGFGTGASLQTSSNVATQGVESDIAAASSSVNSTIRRLAGGIGGQTATILLASYTLGSSDVPSFTAFRVAYLVAGLLCLAGAAVTQLGRPREQN